MIKNIKNICSFIFVSLLLLLAGCLSNRENVSIGISQCLWDNKVSVDVACIKDDMRRQYETCSQKKYWKMDSKLRNNLNSKSFTFDINHPVDQTLSEDDSAWKYWRSDDYLIVVTEMPESYNDVPWKVVIPIKYHFWFNFWDSRDIFIYISDKGVTHLDEKRVDNLEGHYISQENMDKFTENFE